MFVQMKTMRRAALCAVLIAGNGLVGTALARKDAPLQPQEKTTPARVQAQPRPSVIVGGSAKTGEFFWTNQNRVAAGQSNAQAGLQVRTK